MRPLPVVEEGVGQAGGVVGHDLGESPEEGSLDVQRMVVGVEGVGPWAMDNKDMGESVDPYEPCSHPLLRVSAHTVRWEGQNSSEVPYFLE